MRYSFCSLRLPRKNLSLFSVLTRLANEQMKIKWQLFIPQITDIGKHLSELFENETQVRFWNVNLHRVGRKPNYFLKFITRVNDCTERRFTYYHYYTATTLTPNSDNVLRYLCTSGDVRLRQQAASGSPVGIVNLIFYRFIFAKLLCRRTSAPGVRRWRTGIPIDEWADGLAAR